MIRTSACRMDCCRDWAQLFLGALPESYPLSRESRGLVEAERRLCQQGAAMPAPVADAADRRTRMVAEGVSGRAKVFSTPDGSVGVSTYPARRVRDIPVADLLARLTPRAEPARAVAIASRRAGTASAVAYPRFLIASSSGHTRDQPDRIAGILEGFLTFVTDRYGMLLPDRYVTIHLVPDPDRLRRAAVRIHGLDVTPGTLGYAFQEDLSVVAFVTGTAVGTVLHELVHLAERGTFGDVPQWLDEGIAGLYEVSTVYRGGVFGEPNWRARWATGAQARGSEGAEGVCVDYAPSGRATRSSMATTRPAPSSPSVRWPTRAGWRSPDRTATTSSVRPGARRHAGPAPDRGS